MADQNRRLLSSIISHFVLSQLVTGVCFYTAQVLILACISSNGVTLFSVILSCLSGLIKLYRPDHPDLGDCQGNAFCLIISYCMSCM